MSLHDSHDTENEALKQDTDWYQAEIPDLPDAALAVFVDYCGLQKERIDHHIRDIREKAWEVHPYPCIGRYRFLEFSLSRSAHYNGILDRLKSGQKLLDLGCCVGQDIRKLVHDGAPADNLIGVDVEKNFIELGYDLFLDRDTLSTTFFAADVFNMSALDGVAGQIDVVNIGSFLHLFSWEKQREAVRHILRLLRRSTGSLILGSQIGSIQPGEYAFKEGSEQPMYFHNAASFQRFWGEVGAEFGVEWKVVFEFLDRSYLLPHGAAMDDHDAPSSRKFVFSVELVDVGNVGAV